MKNKEKAKTVLHGMIEKANTICLLGHVTPDGDCVGSTLGLQHYINLKYPEKRTKVYLDPTSSSFSYLIRFDEICSNNSEDVSYDLCIVCDAADAKRLGKFLKYLKTSAASFLVDHHLTNEGFADFAYIIPEASSTSELIYDLLDPAYIDKDLAAAIYTGIIHDTGIFKYDCTSRRTMEIASDCMEKGIPFGKIIDDTFYAMELQNKRMLGKVLMEMKSEMDGRFIYGILDYATQKSFGLGQARDTEGFIDNMRMTTGAIACAFIHQLADGKWKVSLRSCSNQINVAEIAGLFGGGGHKLASGALLEEGPEKGLEIIMGALKEQMNRSDSQNQ